MEALVARCRRCGRFVKRDRSLCRGCAQRQQWQRAAYALGAGLTLLALALWLSEGSLFRPSSSGSEESRGVEVRWIPVEVIQEVPVAEEEVRRAFALAGEIRRRLSVWRARYRLPSGDLQALMERVEALQGLLQAAVYEMGRLTLDEDESAEPEGVEGR